MSKKRIDDLRHRMNKENLDGFIVNDLNQVRYLTGYTGSNGLLVVGPREATFLTDFRYTEQAKKQVKGARVTIAERGDLVACLEQYPKLNKRNLRYGFSAQALSVAAREQLKISLSEALMVPADGLVAQLGWVKEREEIANITIRSMANSLRLPPCRIPSVCGFRVSVYGRSGSTTQSARATEPRWGSTSQAILGHLIGWHGCQVHSPKSSAQLR